VRSLRLQSDGRGGSYTRLRGAYESAARVLYRGDWPRALWGLVPGACDVRRVDQRIALLPPGAAPVRAAFVSDLHLGPTTPPRLLDAAFAALAAAQPDLLLLGGDYVFLDASEAQMRELTARVAAVPARRKLAVLGNHDLWTHHDRIERALEAAGANVVINDAVRFEGITIVALDDPWTGAPDAERAFASVGASEAVLVLCHAAEGVPAAERELGRIGASRALYLCGHTHGGHVATPWGPIVVPGRIGRRYPSGLHELEALHLYVSRGVGATEVPVRTFAPPEIAVFEIVARG